MTTRKKIRLPLEEYGKGHIFYVTICTYDRTPWFAKHKELCQECRDTIIEVAEQRGSEILAWCVMPDHVHLLVQDFDLLGTIRSFKGRMTKRARKCKAVSKLWQRSFFDRALRKEQSVFAAAEYTWGNPVRLGLVSHPNEYPWSGSLVWPDWREYYGRG